MFESSVVCSTLIIEIFAIKKIALKITTAITPFDKSLVATTIITDTNITIAYLYDSFLRYLNEHQSNVSIDTIIINPTRTGIGIRTTKSPNTIIKKIKNVPATKVESLPRPPDFTLITD